MITNESTIDTQEVNKFAQLAQDWWDINGPLKTLHDINGTRLEFITQHSNLSMRRVLDVGCGGGILCEAMAKLGAQVTGIDAEPESIKVAKEHASQSSLTINYLDTPIEDYESPMFDVVTCMELLEHVQKPELLLQHCKRLLKPGGLLFVSTINRTLKAYLGAVIAAEYLLKLLPKQTHDYNKFIKPSELLKMSRALEMQMIDMKGLAYNPLTRQASLIDKVDINYILVLS
ncbi:bifunctional 2-polyprenyl-6-hydroxyphenol methylase/3-demethylubiquinol 3-O-methyltransferase UbiG [Legionella waltersii]|uniref:Ubiquinone biosynthesis O-methyltransferase n=1 Tax=Legionella waltersii TaxID=66969 RepID=A0A0W1ALP6_9GAMM|nr:bifunctional 2-polyprenyl-6-hydroxyphenol methylase/3-demethylubiquinol 3-O-methyltransferase UbiG [Legionella waltersii]KTD82230.1 3-demethylubiquinone-9 3-methyltransferase [Legionella waltersii]SNV04612.1 3-demethylubiquinone-9 3-methyltransferase [Legionella waltersii]